MGFCLNRSSKVFAASSASFVALSSVSSFTLNCEGIKFEFWGFGSTDDLDQMGKIFKHDNFYKLFLQNLGLTLYFHPTMFDKKSPIKQTDFIEFYTKETVEFIKGFNKEFVADGFYNIDICNAWSDFEIKENLRKLNNKYIKMPDDLKNKLSAEDFYDICKMISYRCL